MKKCIIMALVCCTCLLVAQDIAGTYRATGQRVEYQFYTRPNVLGSTTYEASGNADGSTTLSIHDSYGLGVTVPIAEIPVGYNFAEIVNGPLGLAYMNALQYYLYVTFNEDGTANIDNSQVLASETTGCETAIALLPLEDEFVYSSNLTAGVPVQPNMVTGQPNASPYVGQLQGTWSVTGSSFFSFFPETPSPVVSDATLYTLSAMTCYQTCLYMGGGYVSNEECGLECMMAGEALSFPGYPHPGTTAGYLVDNPETSFVPGNAPGDLHVEWHYIDGLVAETGLGDVLPGLTEDCDPLDETEDCTDEDNDGTPYDNILGYPKVAVTETASACGFSYPILGDVTGLLPPGCGTYDVDDPAEANDFYLISDQIPGAATFGYFMTFNAAMYAATGSATYLVNDSGHDFDAEDDFTFIDAITYIPCNPADGSPTCIPYSVNG